MPPATGLSNLKRNFLRTAVLLVILAGSVALAWHVSQPPEPTLVDLLHETGLTPYWGTEPTVDWYLVEDNSGTPIGWKISVCTPKTDSDDQVTSYRLEQITLNQSEESLLRSACTLNARARSCQYEGWADLVSVEDGQMILKGSISHAKSILTPSKPQPHIRVSQEIQENGRFHSSSVVPANYAPEGTLSLLAFLAAKRNTPSQLAMVVDTVPPDDDVPCFFYIPVTPMESNEGQWKAKVGSQILTFDDSGKILREKDKDSTTILVSEDDVLNAFPHAVDQVQAILLTMKPKVQILRPRASESD